MRDFDMVEEELGVGEGMLDRLTEATRLLAGVWIVAEGALSTVLAVEELVADMKLVWRRRVGVGRVATPIPGGGLGRGLEEVLPEDTEERCDTDLSGVKYSMRVEGEWSISDPPF